MKKGYLSQYFDGVGVKRLSKVEVDRSASHQHEFNGVASLKNLLGDSKVKFVAKFVFLTELDEPYSTKGEVTWYDSREGNPNRSPEYRLYYSLTDDELFNRVNEGDSLYIAKKRDQTLLILFVSKNTTLESQLLWLFNIDDPQAKFSTKDINDGNDVKIGYAGKYILTEIGIETEDDSDIHHIDTIIQQYIGKPWPSTKDFSKLARDKLRGQVNPIEDPDSSLLEWMRFEELLFARLEYHEIAGTIFSGFKTDANEVDVKRFLEFSKSVQNRRKSRGGFAFEHHISEVFFRNNVRFTRRNRTEQNSEVDFLFPGLSEYQNLGFPNEKLTALAVKTTAKDRWRQILVEAERIKEKHLLTIEPRISVSQTEEMRSHSVQLIIPKPLFNTFTDVQLQWIISLKEFIGIVAKKQNLAAR